MYNTKNKTQKAYKKNKPTLNLIPKNCVCVFPIEIVGGKTLVSNQGIMPNRKYYDKGSFLYWQEVFDGRSALKLQWENSITLEKPEGQNYYLARTSIGSYYYGKPISNGTEQLEITEDASFEDFMSMKASQSVTLRFEYKPTDRTGSREEIQSYFRFILTDNDIYNLYLIPELCENKLMYIESHQEYYDDLTGESKGCEITFATLGDKIQKSGKAIEQYCSWNAPGEFSVRPVVKRVYIPGSTEYEKEVTFDTNALYYPTPVKYLQVEQQGPALTSTIYALGRRQEWDDTEKCWKIGPSKFLFPLNFTTTQPNPLNRTATPSKNYCCFTDEEVAMVTSNKWLQWTLDTCGQPLEQVKNNGMITIGKTGVNGWDTNKWYHTSNQPQPDSTQPNYHPTYYDYYDSTWQPIKTAQTYDINGCIYAEDNMTLNTTDTMIDVMVKNAFIYNQMPIIPLSMISTKPLYLRDIPLIGSIANFFKLGDIHLKNNTKNRQASHLCFFGDADLMSMCARLNGQVNDFPFGTGTYCFPINFFGTNETMYQKLGVNSYNTTFCFSLTDKVNIDGTTRDTVLLGQSKNADGTNIFADGHSLLANSSIHTVTPGNVGYIIDAVVVQSIFDGKIRLSCYGAEERDFIYPQWTATILSNANWENGNVRDWTNIFYLSNWEDRFCVQQDSFTWPEAPHKEDLNTYKWIINASNNFNFLKTTAAHSYWQTTDNHWSTTSNVSKGSQYYGSVSYNKQIYTNTIDYIDLNIASITDKDTFVSYFGTATLNVDKTFLTLDTSHGEVKSKGITGSNLQFNFETGKYEYDLTYKLVGIREDTQWTVAVNDENFWLVEQGGSSTKTTDIHNSSYLQSIRVVLTLGDQITLQIYDISSARTPYQSTPPFQGGGNSLSWCNRGSPIPAADPEGINSHISANTLVFHKR